MQAPRQAVPAVTRVLATITILLGVALVVRTIASGGGPLTLGIVLGVLFVAAGVGRLYLLARTR